MRRLFFALACLALAGSSPAQDRDAGAVVQDASYPLSQGAAATLGPNVVVTLDDVNDSRCPRNVMCMQKGTLSYRFTLTVRGQAEHFTLTPDQPSYTPAALPGVSLTMDPGTPPSAARDDDPAPTHNVTLQVIHKTP